MALEGYLEDLGVCDILQILSLSKKTGSLALQRRNDSGLIAFSEGQVIRASSSLFPDGLGQLLRCQHVITEDQVEEALKYQKSMTNHQPLGKILAELFQIPTGVIERAVETQIEKIVFSFFSWKEGLFSFQLEQLHTFGSALVNPLDFMLINGLSPQRLAIKGQKIVRGDTAIDDCQIDQEVIALRARQKHQGIELLRGMLAELEHPEFCGGIILLILRYASEIMGRAIIFDVRGQRLVGLGQFGFNQTHVSADTLVRKMRLNIDENTLFDRVLREKKAFRGQLGISACEDFLRTFLLGDISRDIFVAPLINDGDVVALLFGDTLFSDSVERSLEAFEVFLSQAGLALEQALQENRSDK